MKGYIGIRYLKWRRSCQHFITNLWLFLQNQKTSNAENDKWNINGVGPLGTKTSEEPKDLRGGKDSPKREASGETYASK